MKRKFIYGAVSLVTLTLALPQAAWANDPPGPTEAVPMILMLPLMALFTAIGGGYAVMKVRVKKPGHLMRIINVVVLVILFFFGLAFQGAALLVALILAALAVQRGVRMVHWGIRPHQGTGAIVPGATPRRLIVAGLGLIIAVIYLAGVPLALGLDPGRQDRRRASSVRNFVTYQLAYAQFEKGLTGEERFNRFPKDDADNSGGRWWREDRKGYRFEISSDLKHFTLYAYPIDASPPWPYRWLSAANSYRADETGKIRIVRVTEPNRLCPPDAPVVTKIEQTDIREWLENQSFLHGFHFDEGLAPGQLKGKWGYVDKFGKIVIPPQFDSAGAFSGGRAEAALRGHPVVIDKSGKLIPSPPAK